MGELKWDRILGIFGLVISAIFTFIFFILFTVGVVDMGELHPVYIVSIIGGGITLSSCLYGAYLFFIGR